MKVFGVALLFTALSNAQAVPFIDPEESSEMAELAKQENDDKKIEDGGETEVVQHDVAHEVEE